MKRTITVSVFICLIAVLGTGVLLSAEKKKGAVSKAAPKALPDTAPSSHEESIITPEHRIVTIGSAVILTAAPSFAENGHPCSYGWQLLHKPAGSKAALAKAGGATASLTPDREGFYIVKLVITRDNKQVAVEYAYIGTPSVVHYVRAGAAGANSGADWHNAWNALPARLERGHTYYVADGSYPPAYYLNVEARDVIPIYIKKAIPADHGTDRGWNAAAMGAGQAVWEVADPIRQSKQMPSGYDSIAFICNSSYIVIDGQVGKKNGAVEKHGFRFSNKSMKQKKLYHQAFIVGDGVWGKSVSHENIKIKHCEMSQFGRNTNLVGSQTFFVDTNLKSLKRLLLHACYIHDTPGVSIYLMNTTNSVIEYCYVARNHSDPVGHGEAIYTNPPCNNNIVRYSIFEDIEGTGIIVGKSGWEVYGNLAFYTPAYVNTPKMGRHAPGVACNNFVGQGLFSGINDCKVYNNTVVGNNLVIARDPSNSDAGNLGLLMWGSNNTAYNNVWSKCYRMDISSLTVSDYNLFINNKNVILPRNSDRHSRTVEGGRFRNEGAFDYHLTNGTDGGKPLPAPYNRDMEGAARGSGGIWTRGAFQ